MLLGGFLVGYHPGGRSAPLQALGNWGFFMVIDSGTLYQVCEGLRLFRRSKKHFIFCNRRVEKLRVSAGEPNSLILESDSRYARVTDHIGVAVLYFYDG